MKYLTQLHGDHSPQPIPMRQASLIEAFLLSTIWQIHRNRKVFLRIPSILSVVPKCYVNNIMSTILPDQVVSSKKARCGKTYRIALPDVEARHKRLILCTLQRVIKNVSSRKTFRDFHDSAYYVTARLRRFTAAGACRLACFFRFFPRHSTHARKPPPNTAPVIHRP